MKIENPTLTDIVASTNVPNGVDPVTAVIANTPSPELDKAVGFALKETQQATSVGSGWNVDILQRSEDEISGAIDKSTKNRQTIYENERERLRKQLNYDRLEGFGEPTDEDLDNFADISEKAKDDQPSEELFYLQEELRRDTEKVQEEQKAALEKIDALIEQTKWYTDINEARRSLARPIKYAAAVLCAVAVGIGSGGVLYKTTETAKQQISTTQAGNPKASSHEDDYIPEIVGAGGVIGGMLVGGVIGGAVAEGHTNRLARVRAKRIVKKSQSN